MEAEHRMTGEKMTREQWGVLWARTRKRVEEIRAEHPPVEVPDDDPEEIAAEVLAEQGRIARRSWASTLAWWPDDDFSRAALADLTEGQQRHAVQAWADDPGGRLLLLHGDAGRGKSHAAFAVGNHFAAKGHLTRAYKHSRLIDALSLSGEGMPERAGLSAALLMQRAIDAEVLVWDEFGAGITLERGTPHATQFALKHTTDLLSARLRGGRTVITTNLSSQGIATLFDDRVVSRLFKSATIVKVTGPDRRIAPGVDW